MFSNSGSASRKTVSSDPWSTSSLFASPRPEGCAEFTCVKVSWMLGAARWVSWTAGCCVELQVWCCRLGVWARMSGVLGLQAE